MSATVDSAPPNKTTVVRGLLGDLLRGKRIGGQRITEAETCGRYRISRTPVREAFFELQGLGLIELRRHCGAVVLPFETRDLGEIYGVRSILEIEAVRLATGRIPRDRLESLCDAFTRLQAEHGVDEDWELDRKLHGLIADASGNQRLAREIFRYGELIQTVREIVGAQALGIHATTLEEHLAILEALLEEDPENAAVAMRVHLEQASKSAMRALEVIRGVEAQSGEGKE